VSEKRVLAVGVGRTTLESMREKLIGGPFELDMAPTPRSALNLAFAVRFDLLVVGHPQPGLVVRDFLRSLRDSSSESREAKVIVLAEDTGDHEIGNLRAHAVEIVPRTDNLIGDLTSKALGGSPRARVSVMVRLNVELAYGRSIRICQSENLSASGMLVRTEDTVPVGTSAEVSFRVHSGSDPIEATARVVRETVPGEIPGIALHFESFRNDSKKRLEEFMAVRLA
jgi:CheY-like chemotaxis protein